EAAGVAFSERMLSWPAGPRPTDGVWGRHWYESVWRSTGFGPPRPAPSTVPDRLRGVVEAARPLYRELYEQRLGR
ncbi:MAG: HAD family hydrolase, partial [Myxococcota bacterium]|nr:HAD family hydrolase [Myxococcota bacterium]